jgi:hypothetical protein
MLTEPKQLRIINRPGVFYTKPTHTRELRIPGYLNPFPMPFEKGAHLTWPMVYTELLKIDPTFPKTMDELMNSGAGVYAVGEW